MVDFKKIDRYIDTVERGEIPEGMTFNEFALEFFKSTQVIPLSKYLKKIEKTSKTPKIMNMKKAGEVLFYSGKDEDVIAFLKRKGYPQFPQMDYKSIMLLRKVEPMDNWMKLLQFFDGKGTIQEINSSLKPKLLPVEIEKLERYLMEELKLNEKELNWLLKINGKIGAQKELERAVKKLIAN